VNFHSANIQRTAFVGMAQTAKNDDRFTAHVLDPNPTGMKLDHPYRRISPGFRLPADAA
jgi:hypothetical protein